MKWAIPLALRVCRGKKKRLGPGPGLLQEVNYWWLVDYLLVLWNCQLAKNQCHPVHKNPCHSQSFFFKQVKNKTMWNQLTYDTFTWKNGHKSGANKKKWLAKQNQSHNYLHVGENNEQELTLCHQIVKRQIMLHTVFSLMKLNFGHDQLIMVYMMHHIHTKRESWKTCFCLQAVTNDETDKEYCKMESQTSY